MESPVHRQKLTPNSPPSSVTHSVLSFATGSDIHDEMEEPSIKLTMPQSGSGREFACGWGAAAVNIIATFPLNKLIFRQQLSGVNTSSALEQLRTEGMIHLYRGILPPLVQKSTSLAIMFGMYDEFNKILKHQHAAEVPNVARYAISAFAAGCMEALLTPLERVQTLLQDKFYHDKYRNTAHAFRELGHSGVREYYRGLTPILMRNGPSNVLFFVFRNDIKELLPKSDVKFNEFMRNFVSGGVLGAVISTMFFPINVVKTRMQRTVGGPYPSFLATFVMIYNERHRSVRAMFSGVHMNYTRSMLSWGIINATYELLRSYFYEEQQSETGDGS